MTHKFRKHSLSWITGSVCLIGAVILITNIPPKNIWVEIGVTSLILAGGWLILAAKLSKKTAGLITVGILATLVMSRNGILEPLTFLLMLIILVGLGLV